MNRRRFIGAAASPLLVASRATQAQLASKAPRIGFIGFNTIESSRDQIAAFRQALRERGWIENENIHIEFRFADGQLDRLRVFAAELCERKVDLIVAASSASTVAAKNATQKIPIVMAASADAVREGFVSSLAHPGGNVTGMTFLVGQEIAGKQLELLKEVAPSADRVAVLANPTNRSHAAFVQEVTTAAARLGAQFQLLQARSPEQLEHVLSALKTDPSAMLLVLTDAMFLGQRQRIADCAARNRLPAMYSQREFVDAGGLMSYGPSLAEMFRGSAVHVDKILRGMNPSDIPVEQPTKFELVINLKTAKALNLAVSQSLLARADELRR